MRMSHATLRGGAVPNSVSIDYIAKVAGHLEQMATRIMPQAAAAAAGLANRPENVFSQSRSDRVIGQAPRNEHEPGLTRQTGPGLNDVRHFGTAETSTITA